MANNRKLTKQRLKRKQDVYSEPTRLFVGRYITDHMLERAEKEGLGRNEALKKYGKNRYVTNPNAVLVKIIYHKR